MKKSVSLFLVLVMVLSLGVPALAAETSTGAAPDTLYIDVENYADSSKTISGVYLYVYRQTGSSINNEEMTHVSGTVYSYDLSSVAADAKLFQFTIWYTDDEFSSHAAVYFESGKNLYTPSDGNYGTWSTYKPLGGSKDVTAYYTPTTVDTEATITGMEITVDNETYTSSTADNPVKIYSDSTFSITLKGKNFDNLLDSITSRLAFAWFGLNLVTLYEDDGDTSIWTIDKTNHTATLTIGTFPSQLENATTAQELKYTNDHTDASKMSGSGIYIVYESREDPAAKAEITGMEITVDGETYTSSTEDNPVKIYSDSTFSIKLRGKNFDNLLNVERSKLAFAWFGSNLVFLYEEDDDTSSWTIDKTNHTATMTFTTNSGELEKATTAQELKYTNDYTDTSKMSGSGIYVIYDSGKKPKAEITSVEITVDGTTYTNGTVTLTSASGDVTVTVKGTNFAYLSDNHRFYQNDGAFSYVRNWTVDTTAGTATVTIRLEQFNMHTTAYQLKYSNDGDETTEDSGIYVIYQEGTTSIDITWGAMSFTYSDEQVNGADKGWTCENGADKVTVKNSGTETLKAQIAYRSATGYTEITGAFDKSTATLTANAQETFTLTLSGAPQTELTNATIGTVTITSTKAQ